MFSHLFNTYEAVTPPPKSKLNVNLEIYLESNSNIWDIDPFGFIPISRAPNVDKPLDQPFVPESLFSFMEDEVQDTPKYSAYNLLITSIVNTGRSFIGKKYTYGGTSPETGFDCSGFLQYIFKLNGVNIPRDTAGIFKVGKEVSLSSVQPGDIICSRGNGPSRRHVQMVSRIDPRSSLIYVIEAKGRKYGIVEEPLTKKSSDIISIRRVLNLNTDNPFLTNQDILKPVDSSEEGYKTFEKAFALAALENPELLKHKDFFIKLCKNEGGFNPSIQNSAGAPYYGYFGFSHAALKQVSNYTMELFRKDPVEQIRAAGRLYNWHIKEAKRLGFYNKAKLMGYSDDAIVAGAWLGGAGGVRNYILDNKDASDSHWYGGKGGTSISKRMRAFN